jgi:hypothetical protein
MTHFFAAGRGAAIIHLVFGLSSVPAATKWPECIGVSTDGGCSADSAPALFA